VGDADVARVADSSASGSTGRPPRARLRAASLDKQMDDLLDRSELDAQLSARKARLGIPAQCGVKSARFVAEYSPINGRATQDGAL